MEINVYNFFRKFECYYCLLSCKSHYFNEYYNLDLASKTGYSIFITLYWFLHNVIHIFINNKQIHKIAYTILKRRGKNIL